MTGPVPPGFVLVDKEQGWTSHDVVAKVRRLLGGKVGHAGTLDPMATGLLILGIGRATKLLRFVQANEKEYVATAQLGVATDSLDADGAIISREPLPADHDQIVSAMERFVGTIVQVPPMVSARRVEGKRLYELAREGRVVEREARPVTIHRLELLEVAPSDYPEITFRVVCSTGTYVRTLADDIARSLGGRAHLTALRRTRNGSMLIENATPVAGIVAAIAEGTIDPMAIERMIVNPWDALAFMPDIIVDDTVAFRVRNGRSVPLDDETIAEGAMVRIGSGDGRLVAVYRRERGALVPEVVLP
ncbi:MAG TPA: tRNA pseudouridine(55) synthase TruB [Acidimicrobiia bacterium]|nr:tRNA pseudouridine(55) synthase TruB [Acidimicrobiia bacterium]